MTAADGATTKREERTMIKQLGLLGGAVAIACLATGSVLPAAGSSGNDDDRFTAAATDQSGTPRVTELAGGSAALAGGDEKPVFVSGNSTSSDCGLPGSDFALSLTGDLEGCWSGFIQSYKCKELEDYDLWLEKGREVFVGEYRGKQGRLRTTYTFEGAYAKGVCESLDFSLEVGGGCRHKVIDGSRVFADAEGLIKFIDVIAGVTGDPTTGEFQPGSGANNFLYYGRIDFDHDRLITSSAASSPSSSGPRENREWNALPPMVSGACGA
jgi:hypothetical protein